MDITREMIRAACMENLHPDTEPSETEMAKMERSLRAALSGHIDPKAKVDPVGYVHDIDGPLPVFSKEAPTDRSWLSLGVDVTPVYTAPSIVAPVGVKPLDIDWKAMYLAARAAQLKTGGSDEYESGHFADKANQAILSALTSAEKAGVGDGDGRLADIAQKINHAASAAYCASLDKFSKSACLGWEAKVASGDFGKTEMEAHAEANTLMGRHQGLSAALEILRALSTTKPAQGDGELITDEMVLAACRAHTPQFDRLDTDIAKYAKAQMHDALVAALKISENRK